jgi:hypothetical protein
LFLAAVQASTPAFDRNEAILYAFPGRTVPLDSSNSQNGHPSHSVSDTASRLPERVQTHSDSGWSASGKPETRQPGRLHLQSQIVCSVAIAMALMALLLPTRVHGKTRASPHRRRFDLECAADCRSTAKERFFRLDNRDHRLQDGIGIE